LRHKDFFTKSAFIYFLKVHNFASAEVKKISWARLIYDVLEKMTSLFETVHFGVLSGFPAGNP